MGESIHASGWERYLPLSGAAFTTLTVAAAAAFPMPPGGDVSPASNPAWLAMHADAVIGQTYVRALAALAFITLAVAAASACRRVLPESSMLPAAALIGGAFSGGLLLTSQAAGLAAALFARNGGSADATRALGAVQNGFLDMSSVPAVLLFAAVGTTSLRARLLPQWLTVVTLLGVPLAALDAASYDGGPLEALGFAGLVYFLGWALLAGVHLYQRDRVDAVAVARAEPARTP